MLQPTRWPVARHGGILALQPVRDGRIVPLVRPTHRLLHAEPPRGQVATNGGQRDRDLALARDQRRDRRAGPQVKRQLQLVRHGINDPPAHFHRLRGRRRTGTRWATARLGVERPQPALLGGRHPLVGGPHAHPE